MVLKHFALLILFCLFFSAGSARAQTAVNSDEFNQCIKENSSSQKQLERCYNDEAQRYMKKIEEFYYNVLPKIPVFKTVVGNSTPEEYFKKMLNTWKLYIKNFCDISAIVGQEYSGDPVSFNRANCLYDSTKEQLNQIGEIPYTYYSNMAN